MTHPTTPKPSTLAERVVLLIDELHHYAAEMWDWKYGEEWNRERAAIAAEVAALEAENARLRERVERKIVEWERGQAQRRQARQVDK